MSFFGGMDTDSTKGGFDPALTHALPSRDLPCQALPYPDEPDHAEPRQPTFHHVWQGDR